ncbi:hypothetical protein ACP0HM_12935 [Escherichia coli]
MVLTDAGQQLALRLERLLDELNSTLRDTGRMGQQLSGKSSGRCQPDHFRASYSAMHC